jgi:hypothetical protein
MPPGPKALQSAHRLADVVQETLESELALHGIVHVAIAPRQAGVELTLHVLYTLPHALALSIDREAPVQCDREVSAGCAALHQEVCTAVLR